MLWKIETAYLYFTDIYWPDIDESEIVEAIKQFRNNEIRRTIASRGLHSAALHATH
jgi:undecaprenyl diphosphate synthase